MANEVFDFVPIRRTEQSEAFVSLLLYGLMYVFHKTNFSDCVLY
jgi:hypothetical protein